MSALHYAQAGVDLVQYRKLLQKALFKGGESRDFFCAPFPLGRELLVASADGVGTKILLVRSAQDFKAIAWDAVAMVVNDLLPANAQPLFFLDYLALGKLHGSRFQAVIQGLRQACREGGVLLLGGETAELPGVYPDKGFDLAGFGVGRVRQGPFLAFLEKQRAGDWVYGLSSSGFHANGFSLLRYIVEKKGSSLDAPFHGKKTLRQRLLVPTRIYGKTILQLFEKGLIMGCAHITGGGLLENLQRTLLQGLCARLKKPPLPDLFAFFQNEGEISDEEAYRVWNMGVGMACIVPRKKRGSFEKALEKLGELPIFLGELHEGKRSELV